MRIGDRIKAAREDLGLNQTEAAARCGMLPNVLSRYESGQRVPGADAVARLARGLEVSAAWLLGQGGPAKLGPRPLDEPELRDFEWPESVSEAERIAIQQEILAEREAHRRALIPYWHDRMRMLIRSRSARR